MSKADQNMALWERIAPEERAELASKLWMELPEKQRASIIKSAITSETVKIVKSVYSAEIEGLVKSTLVKKVKTAVSDVCARGDWQTGVSSLGSIVKNHIVSEVNKQLLLQSDEIAKQIHIDLSVKIGGGK